MSASTSASAALTPAYTAQDLVLDEVKLSGTGSSDRAELYLLNWLSKVEKSLGALDQVSCGLGKRGVARSYLRHTPLAANPVASLHSL